MTRRATFTQADLARAAKTVTDHQVAITITDPAGRVYRIDPITVSRPDDDGLSQWKDRKAARAGAQRGDTRHS